MALPVASRVSTGPKGSVGLRRVTRTMASAARPPFTMGFRITAYMATMGILSQVRVCMGTIALVGALRGACEMEVQSGAQSPAPSNTPGRFGGSDDGSSALAAAHQQAALAGWALAASIWD